MSVNLKSVAAQLASLERQKDLAYMERNQVVAALAKLFPAGVARTPIDGWDPAWTNCVFIDLPTGQASWHYHDSEAHLFAGLPPYAGVYDGHTTPEKYARLAALSASTQWRLVPVEPTHEMLDIGHHQIDFDRQGQNTEQLVHDSHLDPQGIGTTIEQDMRDAWAAMLAASPVPARSSEAPAALSMDQLWDQLPQLWREAIDARILKDAQAVQAVEPTNLRLVPIEADINMQVAGFESRAWEQLGSAVIRAGGWPYSCRESAECVAEIFRAMVLAAPAAPTTAIHSTGKLDEEVAK